MSIDQPAPLVLPEDVANAVLRLVEQMWRALCEPSQSAAQAEEQSPGRAGSARGAH